MGRLENPLTKLLVLRALYDSVKDAKSKGTDFIDTIINHNNVEQSLGDPIMIQGVVDYLMGSLSFIPGTYKKEYKHKIFNEILRCLKLTKDINDINILKPKLISCGTSVADIDVLKRLYEGNYSGLDLNFNLEEKWRIAFRIQASDLYTPNQKKIHLDHMKSIDQSDTGKDWSTAIRGLTCDEKELETIVCGVKIIAMRCCLFADRCKEATASATTYNPSKWWLWMIHH